jgi:2-(1,2-epoxy-1,2-dihydrophenyl)acetyl-CoA isomerase
MVMSTSAASVGLTIAEGVAHIRFQRPEVLNAIDLRTALCLRDAVGTATRDPGVRVIVLSGEGRAFVAGGDLAYFRDAGERAPQAAAELIAPMHEAIEVLAGASQPVLASLQGAVAGAGMSLALAADLAVAADNVVLNMAYARVAATPDCSASWTLPRLVGLRTALEIALLAEPINVQEAQRLGLVNRVVPLHALEAETQALARRLAASAPMAMAGIKRLLREGLDRPLSAQLAAEQDAFVVGAATQDFHEALGAFFGKRAPVFHGR